ncbi:amino acid ABC transporter permease [Zoogloeaceae bacteirum Par-f-2]|jgi:general L-amino acid transport system permease protein|uniref:amino acid ABC transporter permease n=1 Tax=Pseudothauera hydrothermalis TaxID=2184083 RepID=UPI000C7BF715|nr:amino acid ABC transporter permease [Pseudothauera hydrothermalis]AUM01263.1 amino acid ABC transporter permease [Rhodocyclaceae bacterium]AVZ80415.1 amino acid ABC transporter permease [Zoogloeaceae bacteirum Par-f-2]
MHNPVTGPSVRGSLVTDPKVRAWTFQVLAVITVVAVGWYLFHNTQSNLAQRGITSGFAFLDNPAGFGILQSLIDYSEGDTYGRVFLVGLLNTLLVSALGIVIATLIGFVIGVARLSPNWLISRLAAVYIEIFRNIPPLLQIFFWYFAVLRAMPPPRNSHALGEAIFLNIRGLYLPAPTIAEGFWFFIAALALAVAGAVALARWARARREATGQRFPVFFACLALVIVLPVLASLIGGAPFTWEVPQLAGFNFRGGWVVIPELVAITLALSIYTAAFIAEIVRAGIQAVSHGQTEAARSLGLRPGLILRLVIIPQAMRVIVPPLTSQYLNLVKNSSLAAAIGYPDLVSVFAGTVLNQTGQAIETIAITMSVYLAISLSISLLMNWYNKRIALVER